MFNIGGGELIVIAVVALIVLGPDKLPGAMRKAGQVMGEVRRLSSGFQTDLRTALADAEREAEIAEKGARPGSVEAGRAAARAELEALDDEAGTES